MDNKLCPHLIGVQEYNSAMFEGGHDMVFKFLMDKQLISKKHYDSEYWGKNKAYKTIKIHNLF